MTCTTFAGMKRWPVFILVVMTVLGAMVPGCDRVPRYDGRLTALDSLMRDNPDSVVAVLEALTPNSSPARGEVPVRAEEGELPARGEVPVRAEEGELPARGEVPVRAEEGELITEADRAYRDLLLTQARYKAYITATSDSDINRALAYFRAHPADREKLTRAYIYKGAVMDELGHPDSAMLYYKTAEATADTCDYVNLGFINLRIASLFRIYYANEQTGFEKYKTALKYYRYTDNKQKQYICLLNMAMFYGILNNEVENTYLDQALDLAHEQNDSAAIYECLELKCRQLTRVDTTIDEAMRLAQMCLSDYRNQANNDLLLDLAEIYAKQGLIDSACYYLNLVNEQNSPGEEGIVLVRKSEILTLIPASIIGASQQFNTLLDMSRVSDTLLNDKVKFEIERIENNFNRNQISVKTKRIRRLQLMLWSSLAVVLILFTCLSIFLYFRRRHFIKSLMAELKKTEINEHSELLKQIKTKDSSIERFVNNMVTFLRAYAESEQCDSPSDFSKRIKQTIINAADENFWNELESHLDMRYNGLIKRIASYPNIKKNDLKLIALSSCGFSYIEIAIIMGYSRKYISNKRNYIAKKLGIDIPLQDYLKSEMSKLDRTGNYLKQ